MLVDAPSRPRARAGPGRAASLLQRGADREGRGVPHRPAVDLRRADRDRARRAGADRARARRERLAGDPAARARRRGGRGGDLASRPASRRCRCPPSRASGRRTSGSSPRTGSAGRATSPSRRRSAPASPRSAARCSCSACAASGRRWWIPGAVVVVAFGGDHDVRSARSCSTRCSTTSSALPRGRAALRRARARRARPGVDVGEVYEMDASRRTTAANAYVDGPRRDQARRALRHARATTSRRPRRGSSSRTSSATCTTTTSATG